MCEEMYKPIHNDPAVLKLKIREMLLEYGVRDSVSLVVETIQEFADEMSDLGLKESAIQAADMADTLRNSTGA
jgi:hypothetical protein